MWLPLKRPLLGTWPKTQAGALNGNQTVNPLIRRSELNPLSHTSQGRNLKIIYVAYIIFLLNKTALHALPRYSTNLFNKYLLNSFYVSGTRLSTGDTAMKQTDQNPCLYRAFLLGCLF